MNLTDLTPDQLRALLKREDIGEAWKEKARAHLESIEGHARVAEAPQKSTDPRGRMNQTEKRMAQILDMRKRMGFIREWWYESVTFVVGLERTRYTPDFVCNMADGSLEIVEVKGAHIRDDARVKFQVAARQYPFARWTMKQWKKGEWLTLYDYAPMSERAA